jgi:hypothetical protein
MEIDSKRKRNIMRNKTNISDELPNYFKIKSVPLNVESKIKRTRYYHAALNNGK